MQSLKSYVDQILLIWKDSTPAARLGIFLLLAVCTAAIVGVGIWSSRPSYTRLATGLDARKTSELVDALAQANISYQIEGAGSIIMVDRRDYTRAQMVARSAGLDQDHLEFEPLSSWDTPANQRDVQRRNLERQIEGAIKRFEPVKGATVILSLPEEQAFLRNQSPPTASVLLTLEQNRRLDEGSAAAIASLVAGAVEGLELANVAIADTHGNSYSTDDSTARLSEQEEFRLSRERELARKAEGMLLNFLGFGNYNVKVSANFDFRNTTKESQEYDPDNRVITEERISSQSTTDENQIPSGVAGTGSNNANSPPSSTSKAKVNKVEDTQSLYQAGSIVTIENHTTPELKLLTVSVLVNAAAPGVQENNALRPNIKTQIEGIVKQAVGFIDTRDFINVEFLPFVEAAPAEEPVAAGFPWDQVNHIVKNVSLGVAAVVALLLGWMALRKFRPLISPASSGAQVAGERANYVNQLGDLIKQHPDVFSKILETWANNSAGDGVKTSTGEQRNERKAA